MASRILPPSILHAATSRLQYDASERLFTGFASDFALKPGQWPQTVKLTSHKSGKSKDFCFKGYGFNPHDADEEVVWAEYHSADGLAVRLYND